MTEDEYFEEMKQRNPAAYRRLLNSLPDVRDGLNRQQRKLMMTLHDKGLTHDARMKSTAYVVLNTDEPNDDFDFFPDFK